MTKPVAIRPLVPSDGTAPDEHWHLCTCNKQFKHRTSRLGCNFAESHTCPKCGSDVTRIYVRIDYGKTSKG